MTSTTDWRCRGCRAVLGRTANGTLVPLVLPERIGRDGSAALRCPRCGAVRVWKPLRSGLTGDRPMVAGSFNVLHERSLTWV